MQQKQLQQTALLSRFSCYFLPLTFLFGSFLILLFAGKLPHSYDYYLIHFLYTYEKGFIPRGLVGEILSLFFDKISDTLTRNILAVFSVLLIIASALCAGRALEKVRANRTMLYPVVFLLALLFLLPVSFRFYYLDVKLDKLLWALSLFVVYLSDFSIGIWFVPLLCAIATLVNPAFVFESMVLIAIVLLYRLYENHFAVKNVILCTVSYLLIISITLFGVLAEKKLPFSNGEEMFSFFFSRYAGTIPAGLGEVFDREFIFEYFDNIETTLKKCFQIYFVEWENGKDSICNLIFLVIPIFAIIGRFWIRCIQIERKTFQKIIFFFCLITPVVTIPAIVTSWEIPKYFGNSLLVNLCLILFFYVHNQTTVKSVAAQSIQYCKSNPIISFIGIMYFGLFLFT